MKNQRRFGSTLLTAALLFGCGGEEVLRTETGGPPDPGASDEAFFSSLRQHLESKTPLPALDPDSFATVTAWLQHPAVDHPSYDPRDVRVAVDFGTVEVQALHNNTIALKDLEIAFEDKIVSPSYFPPSGLALFDIQVRCPEVEFDADWVGENEAFASGPMECTLDWKGTYSWNKVIQLDPVPITGLYADLHILKTDGEQIRLELNVVGRGEFFNHGKVASLSSPSLSARWTNRTHLDPLPPPLEGLDPSSVDTSLP